MRSSRLRRIVLGIFAAGAVLLVPLSAQQSGQELDVGVRTQVDRNKILPSGARAHSLKDAPVHGKIYEIVQVEPVASRYKLVRPVNARAMADELIRQLEAHGYHQAAPNQKPEILLTVVYGRSWLPNPYLTRGVDVDNMGPEEEPITQNALLEDPAVVAHLRETGVESQASKASFEKLFIMVRAWKNPSGPKEKPQVLWVATMLVDDPDHRDLNVIGKQMLEAGAPYFDQEIKGEEVDIMKPLPEGHVKVGAPEVVKPAK
jgi:hypothetical protein